MYVSGHLLKLSVATSDFSLLVLGFESMMSTLITSQGQHGFLLFCGRVDVS